MKYETYESGVIDIKGSYVSLAVDHDEDISNRHIIIHSRDSEGDYLHTEISYRELVKLAKFINQHIETVYSYQQGKK